MADDIQIFSAGVLSLGTTEYLKVTMQDRHGEPIIDLRIYSDLTVQDGAQTSSGRGIMLPARLGPRLIRALRTIEVEYERRELLGGGK